MKRVFFLFCALIFVFICPADELDPGDFDGAMVYSGREGSLLSIETPEEVYRGSRRPDLGDVRIFDFERRPVPFVQRKRPAELFTPPPEEALFFIWNGESDFPPGTDIEINTSGGIVRIRNQSSQRAKPPLYLVDLSSFEYNPAELRVETEKRDGNFNAPVSIHYSKDLSNWEFFERKQILTTFGETVRDTLELPGTGEARYLLLSFSGDAPPPRRMTVSYSPRERPAPLRETLIKGQRSDDGKRITYETGGFFPAASVDFVLAGADSIPVIIKSRLREEDEWAVLGRETVFRYNSAGGVVKNPPISMENTALYGNRAPYWELESSGTLPFNSVPDMLIRWEPGEIVFPARGPGPWTLSYGNPDCPPQGAAELTLPENGTETEPALFTGERRYERSPGDSPERKDYRNIFLWSFLGAAVIILSILAYTIAKSMRR